MKIYRYLHFLSLDIVIGVLATSCFAARLFASDPGWIWYITLALTVWLLYMGDHMLDAWRHRKNRGEASIISPQSFVTAILQ